MIATTILDYTEKIYYDTDEAGRWRRDVNEGNRIQNELISDAKSIALSAALLLIGGAICDGAAALGYAVKVEKIKNAIQYIAAPVVGTGNVLVIAKTIGEYYDNCGKLENDWWDVQTAEHAP